MKKTIYVEGMSCGHCVKRVENALKSIDGVVSVEVSLEGKKAEVESSFEIEDSLLIEAVDDAGYVVEEIK